MTTATLSKVRHIPAQPAVQESPVQPVRPVARPFAQQASGRKKRVMVAPGIYAVARTPAPAASKLGAVAQELAAQTTVTTLSIAATSGYVYGLTQTASPLVQFQDVPPGMPQSSLQALQSAYTTFQSQFAILQGHAGAWVDTGGTGSASILSQLVGLPGILNDINGSVSSNFTTLNDLPRGSSAYQNLLQQQENLIGAQTTAITQLVSSMQALGGTLESGASSLIASTQTGVLSQMQAAYNADINTLVTDINNANQTISSDNGKIIGEGVGAATSIAVGLVGLINIWNPLGWVMLAGGAVGAYYAITEIEMLKAQIASLKAQIQNDTNYEDKDKAAAATLAAFCNQMEGFASMNQAAQQELAALESLYQTLSSDIASAVADLTANQLQQAQNEWNEILSSSSFLASLAAYLWPSPTLLSAPSMFAALGNDIYCISISGEMYHYSGGSSTWTDMNVKSLSCAGSGSVLVAIDGAPIDGSSSGNPASSSYLVKSYDSTSGTWTEISTFPAAAVAVGGSAIYAINQLVTDRKVYRYSGGTNWTALPALPGPDAATQIAVAGGTVFAVACNSQSLYQYNASSQAWAQVGSFNVASIAASGSKLAIVDTAHNAYVYDPTAGGAPASAGASVASIAQLSNGDQFRMSSSTIGQLWYADTNVQPNTLTSLESNVTSVFASDTDVAYYVDNAGNLFIVTPTGTTTPLPGLPSS